MMWGIACVYGFIMGYEWFYLNRKNRERRTKMIVLGTALVLFLIAESLSAFKDRFQLVRLIEAVFGPVEELIVPKDVDHG